MIKEKENAPKHGRRKSEPALSSDNILRRFTSALSRALTTPYKPQEKLDPKTSNPKPKKEKA